MDRTTIRSLGLSPLVMAVVEEDIWDEVEQRDGLEPGKLQDLHAPALNSYSDNIPCLFDQLRSGGHSDCSHARRRPAFEVNTLD